MEAYKVWVTLNLKGDAQKKMEQFLAQTKKSNEEIKKLTNNLKPLTAMFEKMSNQLKMINPELARFSTIFIRMQTNIGSARGAISSFNSSLTSTSGRLNTASNNAARLATNLNAVARNSGRAAAALHSVRGSGAGRAAGGGHGGGFGGGAASSFAAGAGLGHMNPYFIAGAAAAAIGVGGFKEYSAYEQRFAQVKAQGFSNAESEKMRKAVSSTHLRGISQTHLMEAMVDTAMATGNVDQAIALAPSLAKIKFSNESIMGHSFSGSQQNKLVRFAEMRGGSDIAKLESSLNLGQKLYSATGGRMMPSELMNFQTVGGSAAYHMTDKGFFRLAPIMQELSGFRTGTGYQTMYNQLMTGKGLSTTAAREGTRLGLLDSGAIQYDASGRKLKTSRPALKREYQDLLGSDPVGFVKDVLLPAYAKKGITSSEDITKENSFLFERTAARLVNLIVKNMEKSERMVPLHEQAMGIGESYTAALNLPSGKVNEVINSFKDLLKALGEFSSPTVLKGMEYLIFVTNSMAQFFQGMNTLRGTGNLFMAGGNEPTNTKDLFGGSSVNVAPAQNQSQSGGMIATQINIDGQMLAKAVTKYVPRSINPLVSSGTSTVNVNQPFSNSLSIFGG
jgi:hypothetical protein